MREHFALAAIKRSAHPLSFTDHDYTPLLRWIGDARVVLIGEASHGTHEFYRERARITRLLIEHKGFSAVGAEADWPDAYRVHQYAMARSEDASAAESLSGFRRFPAWMWRNADVLDFVEWLREHNQRARSCAGFYGLDLYSLHASAQAVLAYLDRADPEAAARARHRYGCFEDFGEDTQAYGYAATMGMTESCEKAVIEQLVELQQRAFDLAHSDGHRAREDFFSAERNAALVRDAERYYRTMFGGRADSWNVRDRHMAETLDRLLEHLGPESKVVVWAHNSHLGDARATEMSRQGEINLGQLVRERYPESSFLLGMTTYTGEVTAASNWDEPAERKRVRAALPGSYEELFHQAERAAFLLPLRGDEAVGSALSGPLLERAIGVIYRPQSERLSHYFEARLPQQFDAVIHIDRTSALTPMDSTAGWERGEAPETYPFAV
jgi:erythromycin esterase-like protein